MARIGAQAVGGFFAAPPEIVPLAADLLDLGEGDHVVLDPCAGEGVAVFSLAREVMAAADRAKSWPRSADVRLVTVYACEMEWTRHSKLRAGKWEALRNKARCEEDHGDAFTLDLGERDDSNRGATILWLNPPYDEDREAGRGGRLEERWLRRFGPALAPGGALLFLAPHRSLAASADTLAREFEAVSCWRLPDALFAQFRQVLLVARRRATPLPEPADSTRSEVLHWAEHPEDMPALAPGPRAGDRLRVSGLPDGESGFAEFKCRPLDVAALKPMVVPWSMTGRGGAQAVKGVVPLGPFADLITRSYPVAMPPRAPHIAAGIAAGAYNGASLKSTTPGLPDVLVKGSFRKRFVTVEEKYNEGGDVTGEVQVQQPELTITLLDPDGGRYVELKGKVSAAKATPPLGEFSVGDLLKHYGASLVEVLRNQCPALHDPARDDAPQPPTVRRKLFQAQRHALAATMKLLGGEDRSALVLGELGSGKSTIATAAFAEFGARRPLIFCPPHLVHKSWPDQVRACLGPAARSVVLDSIEAVDRHAADDYPGVVVGILSRESAKLGHAWRGVDADWRPDAPWAARVGKARATKHRTTCPRCGSLTPKDEDTNKPLAPEVLARRRMRCEAKIRVPLLPDNPSAQKAAMARYTESLAAMLAPMMPKDDLVLQLAPRMLRSLCERLTSKGGGGPRAWDVTRVRPLLLSLAQQIRRRWQREEAAPTTSAARLYLVLLHAAGAPRVTAMEALRLYWTSKRYEDAAASRDEYGRAGTLRELARDVLMLLPVEEQEAVAELCKGMKVDSGVARHGAGWLEWEFRRKGGNGKWVGGDYLALKGGKPHIGEAAAGTIEASQKALAAVAALSGWSEMPECGEPLYQAVGQPRRFPLAHYIRQRYPRLFDFLVLDEAHEAGHSGSAQSLAAMQLVNLGLPTVALTGSVMNGYASSLFPVLWALSGRFRAEYGRDEMTRFVRECGYVKRFVEITAGGEEREVNFGAQSDLRDGGKILGQAPGVLPALLLRHLLPVAVPIQLSDLEDELPPKREIVVEVEAEPDPLRRYARMEDKLRDTIKKDRFVKGRAGKLFGALTELASYPDRASYDTGNAGAKRPNAWETRYPPPLDELVCAAEALPMDLLLAKERWLIRTLWAERAEGRRVMVFVWHQTLIPRIARIIAELTEEPVAVLDPGRVQPKVREDWIDREVVRKGVPFLVVNPVAVQTGLNNLVWFHSVVWYESPACNPVIRRQANGRIRRIGQTKEARFYTPVVAETMQVLANQLLLHKQAVGEAVDGLDPEASLAAAGVGEGDALAGRAVGQALFAMLEEADRKGTPGQGAR